MGKEYGVAQTKVLYVHEEEEVQFPSVEAFQAHLQAEGLSSIWGLPTVPATGASQTGSSGSIGFNISALLQQAGWQIQQGTVNL